MDTDCDRIICCVHAAGYTSRSGREHQDSLEAPREGSRAEEDVRTRLLLRGDVPAPLLLAPSELVLEKHVASVFPSTDAAARMLLQGEVLPHALLVSAAEEMRDPLDPDCCVPQAGGWQGTSRFYPAAVSYVEVTESGECKSSTSSWSCPFLPVTLSPGLL